MGTARDHLFESEPDDTAPAAAAAAADEIRQAFQDVDDHLTAARNQLRESFPA